jgi:hypothetical protein
MAPMIPLMIKPAIASAFPSPLLRARPLVMKATGVLRTKASPPRAPVAECHPGFSRPIAKNATGETRAQAKPLRPKLQK